MPRPELEIEFENATEEELRVAMEAAPGGSLYVRFSNEARPRELVVEFSNQAWRKDVSSAPPAYGELVDEPPDAGSGLVYHKLHCSRRFKEPGMARSSIRESNCH